jgi:DHA3 family macrolide efflux protein-like MFS transporter
MREGEKNDWRVRFFTVWGGQAISLLGSQLVQFGLVWWLTQTTGSAKVLAGASLAGFLPQVVLGPLVGALVDRWNRRMTLILADTVTAGATVVLAVLFATGRVEIWHVYALLLVRATAGAFHWTAMTASTSLMVPEGQLARIQGLNQMLNGGMNIASAPLGAVLLSLLPLQGVLAVDVGTALVAVLSLAVVSIPQPPGESGPGERPTGPGGVWADLRAGLRYVWAWPGLVAIMAMAAMVNLLLNPAFALLPLLVSEHFDGQALHLGVAESAWGVGVVLGGLALSAWGGFKRRILTSLLGLVGLGAGAVLVGLVPGSAFPLAAGALFFIGITNPMINGPIFAILQAQVAPGMQGRVLTLLSSVAMAMTPLGLVLAGPLAEAFGVRAWFLAGGALTALVGVAGLFTPVVVQVEEQLAGKAPALATD